MRQAKRLGGPEQALRACPASNDPEWKPALELASLQGARDRAPGHQKALASSHHPKPPGSAELTVGAESLGEGVMWSAQEAWARPRPLHTLGGMLRAWHGAQPPSLGPLTKAWLPFSPLHLAWGRPRVGRDAHPLPGDTCLHVPGRGWGHDLCSLGLGCFKLRAGQGGPCELSSITGEQNQGIR